MAANLLLIELGFPLLQERDDFIELRRFAEKHFPHVRVICAQHRHTVFRGRDSQCPFRSFAVLRPRGFEKQAFVLRHSFQQFKLAGCSLCHSRADQLVKIAVVARQSHRTRLAFGAMELRV